MLSNYQPASEKHACVGTKPVTDPVGIALTLNSQSEKS